MTNRDDKDVDVDGYYGDIDDDMDDDLDLSFLDDEADEKEDDDEGPKDHVERGDM